MSMKYRIEAETKHRIRIRISIRKLTEEQAKILKYAFSRAPGVTSVTIYKPTAGCAITYTGDRLEIIRRLNAFNFENVQMMAEKKDEENARISADEMKKRKLDPELKHKLRMRILGETIADTILPLPVQLAYHAYQMVTLKEM
jgi:hypothetical protein